MSTFFPNSHCSWDLSWFQISKNWYALILHYLRHRAFNVISKNRNQIWIGFLSIITFRRKRETHKSAIYDCFECFNIAVDKCYYLLHVLCEIKKKQLILNGYFLINALFNIMSMNFLVVMWLYYFRIILIVWKTLMLKDNSIGI